ncbi:MAG: hypothetical protein ABW168_03475 [Sedimenticola sp.]
MKQNVRVHIDRLTIHGVDAAKAAQLRHALTHELQRVLTGHIESGGQLTAKTTPSLGLALGAVEGLTRQGSEAGRQIAHALIGKSSVTSTEGGRR